ncbi:T9SS type A sorting domain-containing protein [Flavobacteriales bacterium]|nr:T9SS type A sorting domain-containing protein [Flavobacteriales bacterium]
MRSLILSALLILPFAVFAQPQCSVTLGEDITQCNGNPVTITAVTTGTASEDSLRIVYDATQGVSALVGASEVYFHSGIQSVPFGGFEYTIGNWGADDGVGEMTSLGNDLWEIVIQVPSYYGYPNGTNVIGLLMVFRNGDGTLEGKNDDNENIFLHTSNGNTTNFTGIAGTDIPGTDGSYLWGNAETTQSITVTQTGTYSVMFTDGLGCQSMDEVYVEFGTGNVIINLGADTALCNGEILTLDAGSGFVSYEWSTLGTGQTLEVNVPGDYSVTVTDALGCTGIDLINVSVGASPLADFTYSAVTGTIIEFTESGIGANAVYWDFDGDGNIDETNNGGVPVQYDFGSESVFGVTMIVENGCGTDTATQNVLVQDVSVEELKAEIGFSSYPNPANERVIVTVEDASVAVTSISILDLHGRKVNELSAISNTSIIGLNKLPSGFYVLQVATSKGMINQRILKQ